MKALKNLFQTIPENATLEVFEVLIVQKIPENATLEVLTNLKALKVCIQIIETIDTEFLESLKKVSQNINHEKRILIIIY